MRKSIQKADIYRVLINYVIGLFNIILKTIQKIRLLL